MKVIFLDVDGVLNSTSYFEKVGYGSDCNFDPLCMENLKYLVESTDAYIVVSSDWKRSEQKLNLLLEELEKYGLKDRYIGCTPVVEDYNNGAIRSNRGSEIALYLSNHKCDIFVILDDLDWDLNIFLNNLVLTHIKDGLTKEDADKAIELLNNVRKR